MPEIIDFRVTLPESEWVESSELRDNAYMSNYGRVYTSNRGGGGGDGAEMVRSFLAAGIDRAVLQAEWADGDYRRMNDAVHRLVAADSERLVGYCTVNPAAGDDMATVVEREVREHGMRGVNLQPFAYRLLSNDKRFYPLYAKCQELGIPVTIHTSVNFSNDRSIEHGRPLYLCDVACDFPDLVIVANHGGWPWVNELVAVAWKHPNVYIEIGAVAPKYIGISGSGWELLMQHGNSSLLSDRVLFATDNMIPYDRAVQEMHGLPLKDHVRDQWLGGNASRLLDEVERRCTF